MLWVTEKYVDKDKNQLYDVVDWYETRFDDGQRRDLFKSCSREFGRARAMWVDKPGGGRHQVGWVFEKRVEYEDARAGAPAKERTYLREVWVEVSIGDPRQPTPAPIVTSPWA